MSVMNRQYPRLSKTQLNELKDIVATSKSTLEVKRSQAVLLLDCETDIGLIKVTTSYEKRNIFKLRKDYVERLFRY